MQVIRLDSSADSQRALQRLQSNLRIYCVKRGSVPLGAGFHCFRSPERRSSKVLHKVGTVPYQKEQVDTIRPGVRRQATKLYPEKNTGKERNALLLASVWQDRAIWQGPKTGTHTKRHLSPPYSNVTIYHVNAEPSPIFFSDPLPPLSVLLYAMRV
jgi:hypothetical protein